MSFPPQPLNILIVDDHPEMRHLIRGVISELAAEVNECADGSEALAAYQRHLPDWVLMDIRMRELSGIEATRQLRAAFPEARVVIVSELGNDASRRAAQEAGACAYVLKDNLLSLPSMLRQMV